MLIRTATWKCPRSHTLSIPTGDGAFHVAKLKSEAYVGLGQDFIQMAAQAVTAYYL